MTQTIHQPSQFIPGHKYKKLRKDHKMYKLTFAQTRFSHALTRQIRRLQLVTLVVLSSFGLNSVLLAQLSSGGTPISFSMQLPDNSPTVTMPPVDVAALTSKRPGL